MMSCFLIPKGICSQIESAICKFWWGSKDSNHKIHWKAKNDLFKPKFIGGLGFRDMHLFNIAMLAKQGWRLHVNPNSLLSLCLKAKYYPNHDVMQAQAGYNPSYTWRSIHQALKTLKKGSCWNIGKGDKVHIWRDNWIPQQNGYKILTPKGNQTISLVSELMINQHTAAWNIPLIDSIFMPSEGELIKQIPITQNTMKDKLMWPYTKDGCYDVKSGYNILKHWQDSGMCSSANTNTQQKIWKKVWSLPTIPRHKALLWRIANNVIPVRSALSYRGIPCSIICPRCLKKEETISHLFMECDRTTRIWFGSNLGIKFTPNHTNFIDWLFHCISTFKKEDLCYVAAILYGIWWARNKQVFEDHNMEDKAIIDYA
jgi:hypothetical protein